MVDLHQKGLDLRTIRLAWMTALLAGWASLAWAQGSPPRTEDQVLINLDVGYNSAYRDRTWVPIDVYVRNEQSDIQGMVEVRTYTNTGDLQSPIYRIPADCPRDSQKRFRLMAYLDRAARVEAWIYERGRPAVDTPAYMDVSPIRSQDLLGLMLDNDPLNYTFLTVAVDEKNDRTRFFRQPYLTPDLGRLPGHIKAYEAVDFVLIGDMDPSRIPQTQRDLLWRYVERGGLVIVQTGLLGTRFDGTWVEKLAGVEIGETETMPETQAGEIAFAPVMRSNLVEDREIGYTTLRVPEGDDAIQFGWQRDRPLAVRRSLGSGYVCTLAVDAGTHAFQESPEFRKLWSQIMFARTGGLPLNYELFASSASQLIPSMSGVSVRSKWFLFSYLALYLGVGVLGNWLFWSYFKRREMAWVCLVFISAGFSSYAYVEGTAGWAKSAKRHQLDVVHVRPNSQTAEHFGLTGVLTSHTRSYEGVLAQKDALIRDVRAVSSMYFSAMATQRSPFVSVQGEDPVLQGFVVGAAEMRFLATDGTREVEGGFEGELTVDRDRIRGTFQNQSGLEMDHYALIYDGAILSARVDDEGIHVDKTVSEISRDRSRLINSTNDYTFHDSWNRQDEDRVLAILRQALVTDSTNYQLWSHYPPMLIGWRRENANEPIAFTRDMELEMNAEMVVGEVRMNDLRMEPADRTVREQLMTSTDSYQDWQLLNVSNTNGWSWIDFGRNSGTGFVRFRTPSWMTQMEDVQLEIVLYAASNGSGDEPEVGLTPGPNQTGDPREWHDAHVAEVEDITVDNRAVRTITYRVDDWEDLVDLGQPQDCYMRVRWIGDESDRRAVVNWGVTAHVVAKRPDSAREEWAGWQSSK